MGWFSGSQWFGGQWFGGQWFGPAGAQVPKHKYDTLLPKPQRTLIREGIIARLAPLLKANGGYLAAIVELPKLIRNIDESNDDRTMLFDALNGRSPGVGVALGRRETTRSGSLGTENEGTIEVGVYVASQHARSLVDGRLSNDVRVEAGNLTLDPGIETILEHVEQLLLGHSLKDEDGDPLATIREIRATSEDEIGTFSDLTMWEQKYEVGVERVINPARNVTQLLLSIQGLHTENGLAAVTPGTHSLAPLTTLATLSPPED